MKILHYYPWLSETRGGSGASVVHLVRALRDDGHDVGVLTLDPDPGLDLAPTVADPPRLGLRFAGRDADRLHALVAESEVVHLHGVWTAGNPAIAAAARNIGVPYVLTLHGELNDQAMARRRIKKRVFLSTLGRHLLGGAAVVHATSPAEMQRASRWLWDSAVRLVEKLPIGGTSFDAVAPRLADEALGLPPLQPVVLILGRLDPGKGVDVAITAMRAIADSGSDAHLVVAGAGDPRYAGRLTAMVEELQLQDHVTFTGLVDGDVKRSLFARATVFVLPTAFDSQGLVCLEAMAAGTPVVTTRGVDIWRELEGGGGAVIAGRTPAGIAEALRMMIDDPQRASTAGAAGREWAAANVHPASLAGRYADMYRQAMAPSP